MLNYFNSRIFPFLLLFFGVFGYAIQKVLGIEYARLFDDLAMIYMVFFTILIAPTGKFAKINRVLLWLGLFILITFISAIFNQVPIDVYFVQMRTYGLPIFIILFFYITPINDSTLKYIVNLVMFISILLFLGALFELIIGRPIVNLENRFGQEIIFESGVRVASFVGNPIDFGNFIVFALILFYAGIKANYLSERQGLFLILICFLCLIATASRGPFIAFVGAFIIYFWNKRLLSWKLITYLILAAPLIYFLGGNLLSRFLGYDIESLYESQYRFLYLSKSVQIFLDHIMVGVGPGMFGGWVSINYHTSPIYEIYDVSTKGIASIDMFWPHFLTEVGILGTLLFLLSMNLIYKKSKQFSRSNNNSEIFFSTFILLAFPAVFLMGFFSLSLETQLVSSILSVVCGMSLRVLYEKSSVYSVSKR